MTDLRSLPSYASSYQESRSLFSARKLALMASVVTGLGMAIYGFTPSSNGFEIIGAAHAQVSSAVSGAAQPSGFADMVERVKPSVISVKVTMKEKASDANSKTDDDKSASPMERFFRRFGGPDGMPKESRSWRPARHDGPGFRLLHFGRRLRGDQQSRRRWRRQG